MISFGKLTTKKILEKKNEIKKPIDVITTSKHPENFNVRLHKGKELIDFNVNVLSQDFRSSIQIIKSVNGENIEMIDVKRNGDVDVIDLKEPFGSPFRTKREDSEYEDLRIVASAIVYSKTW